MPRALASRVMRSATSRTCPTEPAAPVSSAATSVCTESITQTSGRYGLERREHGVEVGLRQHRDVERAPRAAARRAAGPAPATPRRRRRASSGRRAPRLPSAIAVSVDLPMPGEPPSRTTEPGTSPPPSTRSSSPIPVLRRDHVLGLDVGQPDRNGRRGGAGRAAPRGSGRGLRRRLLDQRVPLRAARALTHPARRVMGTFGADKAGLRAGHRAADLTPPPGQSPLSAT